MTDHPLFGGFAANPSGFESPATRSFANIPGQERGEPGPAPYSDQHTEDVLADKLGLASGQIAALIDRGVGQLSDKI